MPYRAIVLISENIVLTAGHNLFDSRRNSNSNDYLMAKVERDYSFLKIIEIMLLAFMWLILLMMNYFMPR